MYLPSWVSQMVVAVHDDIKNTAIGTEHCHNNHISISGITNRDKAGMMLHACIWADHDTVPVN